jgi:hypothetical protein
MKRYVCAAAMVSVLAGPCVWAQETAPAPKSGPPAQLTLPPDFEQPDEAPPDEPLIECDLRASPDYVPGIDAKGREVVPADVPTGRQVEIDTQVFVETRSSNPQLRGTGVIVNLPGLGAPACVPLDDKLRK